MSRIITLYAWVAKGDKEQLPTSTVTSPQGVPAAAPMFGRDEATIRSMRPVAQQYAKDHKCEVELRRFVCTDAALDKVQP